MADSPDGDDKPEYLELSDDFHELRYGYGKERAVAGLKLVGKGLFNVVKFAFVEVLPAATRQMESRAEELRKEQSKK